MCPAQKKEFDISKNKIRTARTNFVSCMAGGGGFEEELIKGVAESLGDVKQKQAQEEKTEEQALEMQKQALKQQQQMQDQQAVATEAEKHMLDREIKKVQETIPTTLKIIIAAVIAVGYDILSPLASAFTAGTSSLAEPIGDIIMQMIVMPSLLGSYYQKYSNKLTRILEFLPITELWPSYSIAVYKTWRATSGGKKELAELKKEKGKLSGGAIKKGILGMSPRNWIILITLFVAAGIIGYFMLGLAGAAIPIAIFIFILFLVAYQNPETKDTVKTIVLLLLILGSIAGVMMFAVAPFMTGMGGPLGDTMRSWAAFPTKIGEWWANNNPWNSLQNYYKKQVAYATGDYYTGKVDENAKTKLGVYLEDIKQADPVFYTDRPVGMFATLTVQTLDEPVNVTIVCSNDKAIAGATPKIFPKTNFVVETYEEQDIDCMYDAGAIQKDASVFKIGADFNFKTMGYVKGYFMDNERLRTMRREEIDPLDQYGIKDKNPSAIYTNGPVGIGMGFGSLPVGIDLDSDYEAMTLGITLENKWQGKIMGVSRMIVILPKGFVLEEIGAQKTQISCKDLKPEEQELCDEEFNIVYSISDPTFVTIDKGNFKSYRGFLRVNSADYEKILGKINPISTKYFKVLIDYTYRLEQTKTITVRSRTTTSLPFSNVNGAGVDMTAPIIKGEITVENVDGGIEINWNTDEASNDMLTLWETSKPQILLTTENEAGFSTKHSRGIAGLSTGKAYGYKITSTDEKGNSATITRTFNLN